MPFGPTAKLGFWMVFDFVLFDAPLMRCPVQSKQQPCWIHNCFQRARTAPVHSTAGKHAHQPVHPTGRTSSSRVHLHIITIRGSYWNRDRNQVRLSWGLRVLCCCSPTFPLAVNRLRAASACIVNHIIYALTWGAWGCAWGWQRKDALPLSHLMQQKASRLCVDPRMPRPS